MLFYQSQTHNRCWIVKDSCPTGWSHIVSLMLSKHLCLGAVTSVSPLSRTPLLTKPVWPTLVLSPTSPSHTLQHSAIAWKDPSQLPFSCWQGTFLALLGKGVSPHLILHFISFCSLTQLSKSFIICQIWVQTTRKEQRVLDSFVLRMYLLKMEYHTYNPHPWHISTYPRDKFFLVDQTQKDRQSASLSCS